VRPVRPAAVASNRNGARTRNFISRSGVGSARPARAWWRPGADGVGAGAFPDRVARRRKGNDLLLASGGSAVLSPASVVRDREFLVAVDVEEAPEAGCRWCGWPAGSSRSGCWNLFADRVTERRGLEWKRAAERVEEASLLLFDKL